MCGNHATLITHDPSSGSVTCNKQHGAKVENTCMGEGSNGCWLKR